MADPVMDRVTTRTLVSEDGCWLWTAGKFATGYGAISVANKTRRAHRVVYEALVGPIPDGAMLHHLCGVRECVNPSHLIPVTHLEHATHHPKPQVDTCQRGHQMSGANLYVRPNGMRECRTCKNLKWRERKARIANG